MSARVLMSSPPSSTHGAVVLFCCGAVVPWCVTGRPVFHFALPKLQRRQTAAAGLDIKDICLCFFFFFLFLPLPSGMSAPVKAQRIVGKLLWMFYWKWVTQAGPKTPARMDGALIGAYFDFCSHVFIIYQHLKSHFLAGDFLWIWLIVLFIGVGTVK